MKSLWMQAYDGGERTALKENIETDTVVVGAGMAGVLTAHLLKERGIDTVVLEATRIGTGVTKNTTAKVTAQHAAIYAKIEKQYGLAAAKGYLHANLDALKAYRRLARDIPCDFEEKTAYVYSRDDRNKLDQEAATYRRMGLDVIFDEKPSIPVKTVGALGMAQQAQFHPIKFINQLSRGLKIYEDSFVTAIQKGLVRTREGSVRARCIVLATHYPMLNLRGLYFLKLYQHRSYVLALKGAPDPGAMYIDEAPTGLSFRSYGGLVLLGGGSHRTGKPGGGWEALRRTAATVYPGAREQSCWATQDCMTLDGIPYIGRLSQNENEWYVATGFNKWGMTGSMVAARLLSELLSEGKSRYAALFSPDRPMLHPQVFLNTGQAALGWLSWGKRCPHMGCALKWNAQEHTWDCPCHGSRFEQDGAIIDNPARRGLHME